MTTKPVRFLALLALLPLTGGCFEYVRVEPAGVSPGTPVRVHLAEPRDLHVGNLLVPSVVLAEGNLIRVTGDSAIVAVEAVERSDATRMGTARALVWLPRERLDHLEEKRLDPSRTALAAGGIVLAVALLADALLGGDSGGTVGNGDPGGPIASRIGAIPLLRIPLSF